MPMPCSILWSGQSQCYDAQGQSIPCQGSGQDAEFRPGLPWPRPRFTLMDEHLVADRLTGLIWLRNANYFDFPVSWHEGQKLLAQLRSKELYGRNDWRMPKRHELRSLVDHGASRPALPADHPFRNLFWGWYWSSTEAAIAPGYVWRLQPEGGRLFYGNKEEESFLWPVAASSPLWRTPSLASWQSRFYPAPDGPGMADRHTGLIWYPQADYSTSPVDWPSALHQLDTLRDTGGLAWRLPAINELESLVDVHFHSPALTQGHPFTMVRDGYWSSTTSTYDPAWSYVLYLHRGAVGVGFKPNRDFYIWPVRGLCQD